MASSLESISEVGRSPSLRTDFVDAPPEDGDVQPIDPGPSSAPASVDAPPELAPVSPDEEIVNRADRQPEVEVADGYEGSGRGAAQPGEVGRQLWNDTAIAARLEAAREDGELTEETTRAVERAAEALLASAPNEWPVRLTGTDVAAALQEVGVSVPERVLAQDGMTAVLHHLNSAASLDEQRERLVGTLQDLTLPEPPAPVADDVSPEEGSDAAPVVPRNPPGFLLWTDDAVGIQRNAGVRQAGLTDESAALNRQVASEIFDALGTEEKVEFTASDVALLVEGTGGYLDETQIQAAANYINRGASAEQQRERLATALDNFSILQNAGVPKLNEEEFVQSLWTAASIPGHAVDGFSDDKKNDTLQMVAASLLTPGESKFKIDNYNVKLKVSDDNQVLESETKKPSNWKSIALTVGTVVAGALTGGVAAIAIRVAMSAYSAVQAIRQGSVLGAVASIAGAVAGGIQLGVGSAIGGAAKMAATIADTTARAARATQGALNAIQAKSGAGILGALADGTAAAAGALGNGASDAAQKLTSISQRANTWAMGAAAVENVAKGDVTGAVGQGLSFGAVKMGGEGGTRLGQVGRAVSALDSKNAFSVVAAAAQFGSALTSNERIDQASSVLTATESARMAYRTGDVGYIGEALFDLGGSIRENRGLISGPKKPAAAPSVMPVSAAEVSVADVELDAEALSEPEPPVPPPIPTLNTVPLDLSSLIQLPGAITPESLAPPVSTYKVKKGDSLEAIAARNNLTVDDLRLHNPDLKGDRILIGADLNIPMFSADEAGAAALQDARARTNLAAKAPEGNYKVKSGDTLEKLARENPHLTRDEIFTLNQDRIAPDGQLLRGQSLNLPSREQIVTLPDGRKGWVTPDELAAKRDAEARMENARLDAIQKGTEVLGRERQYVADIEDTRGFFKGGLGAATYYSAREYSAALEHAQSQVDNARTPQEVVAALDGLNRTRQQVRGFAESARSFNAGVGEVAKLVLPTAAAIAAIPFTAGMSAGGAVVLLGGVGATARVATNAAVDGTLDNWAQDAVIGAVQGATVFVGNGVAAGVGRAIASTGVRAGAPVAGRIVAAGAQNLIEGGLGGAVGGGLESAVTLPTYEDGAWNAAKVIAQGTARGGAYGAIGGGALGGLGAAFTDGLVGAADDVAARAARASAVPVGGDFVLPSGITLEDLLEDWARGLGDDVAIPPRLPWEEPLLPGGGPSVASPHYRTVQSKPFTMGEDADRVLAELGKPIGERNYGVMIDGMEAHLRANGVEVERFGDGLRIAPSDANPIGRWVTGAQNINSPGASKLIAEGQSPPLSLAVEWRPEDNDLKGAWGFFRPNGAAADLAPQLDLEREIVSGGEGLSPTEYQERLDAAFQKYKDTLAPGTAIDLISIDPGALLYGDASHIWPTGNHELGHAFSNRARGTAEGAPAIVRADPAIPDDLSPAAQRLAQQQADPSNTDGVYQGLQVTDELRQQWKDDALFVHAEIRPVSAEIDRRLAPGRRVPTQEEVADLVALAATSANKISAGTRELLAARFEAQYATTLDALQNGAAEIVHVPGSGYAVKVDGQTAVAVRIPEQADPAAAAIEVREEIVRLRQENEAHRHTASALSSLSEAMVNRLDNVSPYDRVSGLQALREFQQYSDRARQLVAHDTISALGGGARRQAVASASRGAPIESVQAASLMEGAPRAPVRGVQTPAVKEAVDRMISELSTATSPAGIARWGRLMGGDVSPLEERWSQLLAKPYLTSSQKAEMELIGRALQDLQQPPPATAPVKPAPAPSAPRPSTAATPSPAPRPPPPAPSPVVAPRPVDLTPGQARAVKVEIPMPQLSANFYANRFDAVQGVHLGEAWTVEQVTANPQWEHLMRNLGADTFPDGIDGARVLGNLGQLSRLSTVDQGRVLDHAVYALNNLTATGRVRPQNVELVEGLRRGFTQIAETLRRVR